ncbi:MAG: dTDP-4-dehydrorhamnose reductase [Candidatus Lokiarchaeota archaeon]|nr:dTDP-4-dehydrorhamnose reductase [Candidatus Lokiarchaeota archaeon]MBD3200813.1 dTDP-4-dehydrorhamnose reductase [Candidatus Lokiarchaeota archaeon]
MKKLLIIGASGLTGYQMALLAQDEYHLFGTYNHRNIEIPGCDVFHLDKTDFQQTKKLIEKISPDIIVDCSALHNVDYCETHQEETLLVNVKAPKFIAEKCEEIGARFIYISTDYVFDGTQESPYTEESKPNPLNFYGTSKLKAEREIANVSSNYAIGRTSLVFGWNPNELSGKKSSSGKTMNYVIWVLGMLRKHEKVRIVNDQYSNPTYAPNLAEMLLSLAELDQNGIFHTAGQSCVNRYEFTLEIADVFNIDKRLISPVLSSEFNQVADRPNKPCLNIYRIEKLSDIDILTSREALIKMKKNEEKYE